MSELDILMPSSEPLRNDFRGTRVRLPPEAFAIAEGPDEPPHDLVKEDVWNSIMSFPDDVSLRTSDQHGVNLEVMHTLWGSWIESYGEDQDAIWYFMLDAADEFQASIFNSLCGFYRVAADGLRAALEKIIIGAYFQLTKPSEWKPDGEEATRFHVACDALIAHARLVPLNDYLRAKVGYSIFDQKSLSNAGGWARRLYSELSEYAHARPDRTSSKMWEGSNGPIYVPSSFGEVYALYLDTMALAFSVLKLTRLTFSLPLAVVRIFSRPPQALPSKVAVYSLQFLFGKGST